MLYLGMASTIVVGSPNRTQEYLEKFIQINEIKPFQIVYYNDDTKIETARLVKKNLSLASSNLRFLIFQANITPEAQNALLKVIEEGENVHFIFCVAHADLLLPTIHSRSVIKILDSKEEIDTSFLENIKTPGKIDDLNGFLSPEKLNNLLSALRHLMLTATDLDEISKYHAYCKRFIHYASLASINNVNERIILEKIFQA